MHYDLSEEEKYHIGKVPKKVDKEHFIFPKF